ncbi:MAG: hypothetical protein ABW221_04825 [Vicinamibacteria bacterium]
MTTPFPVLRWVALGFVLVLVPAYAAAYGPANFVFLCNLSLFLTTIGLFTGSRLLLSSQAVGLLAIAAAWTLDLGLRLLLGRHLIGGTEYMWDARFPLATRLLSLYHVGESVVLVYALRRLGYDRRGYLLQSAIAVAAVAAGRLCGPEANVNHAFVDPVFRRAWGGAWSHVAAVAGTLVLVVYPLTHLALARWLPQRTGPA